MGPGTKKAENVCEGIITGIFGKARVRSELERIGFAGYCVSSGARADGALLRGVVDVDEAEAEPEALVPFEIVEERPVEISADRGAGIDGPVEGDESGGDEALAHLIRRIGDAVFEDVDRLLVGDELDHGMIEGLGVILPAEVGTLAVRILAEAVVDDVPIVVIEPDEILCALDAVQEEEIPAPVSEGFEQRVDECRPGDLEMYLVLGDADR